MSLRVMLDMCTTRLYLERVISINKNMDFIKRKRPIKIDWTLLVIDVVMVLWCVDRFMSAL